ncbi:MULTISPECIES: hypothetical protein [Paenibacillus]|uniref:DUF4025 domain-containing protein n=1 Tax=Paenibacillus vini TaxID=1476024 RepID=A0ABQ4M600_9BACL|nr:MULTISPECIES: hypothetical protein [Paenibacillus]MBQ4900379.1 hypothetical protein [Paenibacillus sp. Marseille-P2973]MDN4066277.1 hypothetical protein [Paenibacillus vini]GIP51435.1 hypothetical protein J42TS3_04700 [Paenibacillus vini]
MASKREQHNRRVGNGSSNAQNASTGNGGEGRAGRLSQIKNHASPGDDVPNEYISGEDLYDH